MEFCNLDRIIKNRFWEMFLWCWCLYRTLGLPLTLWQRCWSPRILQT